MIADYPSSWTPSVLRMESKKRVHFRLHFLQLTKSKTLSFHRGTTRRSKKVKRR